MIDYAPPSPTPFKESRGASVSRGISSVIAWTFIAVVVLPVFAGVAGATLGKALGYFVLAAGSILLLVQGNTTRIARQRRVRIVLGYLETAVSTNLPLGPVIDAAAQSETPGPARRLRAFREAIEDGVPIGTALLLAVPHAPSRTIDLINAAAENGRLPAVLPKLLETRTNASRNVNRPAVYPAYTLIVLLAIAGVMTVLSVYVFPKLVQLAHDFGAPVPPLTLAVIAGSEIIGPVIGGLAAVTLLVAEGRALRQVLSAGRTRANPFVELTDRVIWFTPLLGRAAYDRGLADAFGVMAGALHAGRPVHDAVREATMPHLNHVLRQRLHRCEQLLASGRPMFEAATAAHLPAIVAGLLASGERLGNTPDALRFLASHYESRFSRIDYLIRGCAVPAVALALGSVVLFIGLGLFQALAGLSEAVETWTKLW